MWAAAGIVLAAALAAGWGGMETRGPVLWQVSPEPGATLMLRKVPIEAQLSEPYTGYGTLYVDGRPLISGLPVPYLSALPEAPLTTGRHSLRVDVLMPGRSFSYTWHVTVAKSAQAAVGPYDDATYEALDAVNGIRATAGVRPWRLSTSLEGASRAHSRYFYDNLKRYGTLTDSVHNETPGWPLYTGRTPWARDVAFGYNGDGDSEVMAFGVGTAQAVSLWLDSIYHRFGLIDPGLTSMGFGIAGQASKSVDLPVTTLNAGWESRAEVPDARPIVWPVPGQSGIPRAFEAGEIPDPLANFPGARYPAGYPVTVSFFGTGVKSLDITAATLTEDGRAVAYHLLTPKVDKNPQELGMSAAILPVRPLAKGAQYEARFSGRYRDGHGWHQFAVKTSFTAATT